MKLVAVGDVDSNSLQQGVNQAFAGWSGGSQALRNMKVEKPQAGQPALVDIPGKTSVSILLGQASRLQHQHPDYQALRMGTAILGSGFTGRLMATVRDKEGLTYNIDAALENDSYNEGDWKISASFAPAMLEQGIASTRKQLELWYQKGVTDEEVESRKSNLIGAFQVGLGTTSGLSSALLNTLNRGYPLEWVDDYPAMVRGLSAAKVNAAIKTYLQPKNMILVEAGSLSEPKK
jgi:zinc protease